MSDRNTEGEAGFGITQGLDTGRTHFFGDDCEGGHWDDEHTPPKPPAQTIGFESAVSENEGRDL